MRPRRAVRKLLQRSRARGCHESAHARPNSFGVAAVRVQRGAGTRKSSALSTAPASPCYCNCAITWTNRVNSGAQDHIIRLNCGVEGLHLDPRARVARVGPNSLEGRRRCSSIARLRVSMYSSVTQMILENHHCQTPCRNSDKSQTTQSLANHVMAHSDLETRIPGRGFVQNCDLK